MKRRQQRENTRRINQRYQNSNDNYRQQLHMFTYKFNQPQLMREFEATMKSYNITGMFSNRNQNLPPISVSYAEARSTVDGWGKSQRTLMSIANAMQMTQDNISKFNKFNMEQQVLKVIADESRSLTKFINELDKFFNKLVEEGFQWNVVFYQDYEERTFSKP